jgi:hypothetical protein
MLGNKGALEAITTKRTRLLKGWYWEHVKGYSMLTAHSHSIQWAIGGVVRTQIVFGKLSEHLSLMLRRRFGNDKSI